MTVAQRQVVDWLGIEKDTGSIGLTVIDDLDWDDERNHILLLQEKLNTYLAFIEGCEVYTRLKSDFGVDVKSGTRIKVSILAKFDLPSEGARFLKHVTHVFGSLGVSLTHRVVRVPNE